MTTPFVRPGRIPSPTDCVLGWDTSVDIWTGAVYATARAFSQFHLPEGSRSRLLVTEALQSPLLHRQRGLGEDLEVRFAQRANSGEPPKIDDVWRRCPESQGHVRVCEENSDAVSSNPVQALTGETQVSQAKAFML